MTYYKPEKGTEWELFHGDCMANLEGIEDGSVELVLTDPPYSSGGLYAGDRKLSPNLKYFAHNYNGAAAMKNFTGDNMDQHAFAAFLRYVLFAARMKTVPGGVCAVFTDWRQLPTVTDVIQGAGWMWRGIVVWNKQNSRAIPRRFRNDCEYVVWGTNGNRDATMSKGNPVYPGCYSFPSVPSKQRYHQTEKPVEVLERLVQICPSGGLVYDPFAGSGSTGVACIRTGRRFVGCELDGDYFRIAADRLKEAEERWGDHD